MLGIASVNFYREVERKTIFTVNSSFMLLVCALTYTYYKVNFAFNTFWSCICPIKVMLLTYIQLLTILHNIRGRTTWLGCHCGISYVKFQHIYTHVYPFVCSRHCLYYILSCCVAWGSMIVNVSCISEVNLILWIRIA